jgi:protein-S-isoprenylcysteine O-methyltransferase Ste14
VRGARPRGRDGSAGRTGGASGPHATHARRGRASIQALRVPLGFVAGAAYLWWAPRSPALTPATLALGAGVAGVGLLVRGWAAGHIVKNDQLATGGPYAFTRNPLYLGSFLLAVGFAVAAHPGLVVAVVALWAAVYLPVMRRERAEVRARFPDAYDAWAAHVPMFLPRLTPWRPGAAEPARYDPGLYRRHREWQAALGYVGVLAWLAWGLRGRR